MRKKLGQSVRAKRTPRRKTARRSKTTPDTSQSLKTGYLEVTPTCHRRTRSAERTSTGKHALDSQPDQTKCTTTRALSNRGTPKISPFPEKLIVQFSKLSTGKGKDNIGTNKRSDYDDAADESYEDYLETDDSSDAEDSMKDFTNDSDCS